MGHPDGAAPASQSFEQPAFEEPPAEPLDVFAEPTRLDSFVSDRNRFFNAVGTPEKFFVGGKTLSLGEWRRLSGTRTILIADPRSVIVALQNRAR